MNWFVLDLNKRAKLRIPLILGASNVYQLLTENSDDTLEFIMDSLAIITCGGSKP